MFPLMNGTNWLKTLVGGDERAGCYSVRARRKHKQHLDSVQPDVGAHSGEPLSIVCGGEDTMQGTVSWGGQPHKGARQPRPCCGRKHFGVNYSHFCGLNRGVHLWPIVRRKVSCVSHWPFSSLRLTICRRINLPTRRMLLLTAKTHFFSCLETRRLNSSYGKGWGHHPVWEKVDGICNLVLPDTARRFARDHRVNKD